MLTSIIETVSHFVHGYSGMHVPCETSIYKYVRMVTVNLRSLLITTPVISSGVSYKPTQIIYLDF